jgi:predicted PurR-regulated permease PerM
MSRFAFRTRRLKARWRLIRRGGYAVYVLRPLFTIFMLALFFAFLLDALKNRGASTRVEASRDTAVRQLLGK